MGISIPDPSTDALVYLVMLNWNDAPNSLACLRSVQELDYQNFRIVVVDNGSEDGSEAQIRAQFPDVHLICNQCNLGFAGGMNKGLDYAMQEGADFILLVNNDTLLDPALLKELVQTAQAHPKAGLLAPKIYFYHDRSLIWAAGARWVRFPPRFKIIGLGKRDHPRYDVLRQVDAATGCVLMIRRQVIDTAGRLDSTFYPIYHEDYDYCARVRKAGWEIWYVPTAKLWHKDAQSQRATGMKAFNLGKNIVPFYLRHGNPPWASLYLFITWAVLREIVKGNLSFAKYYLSGVRTGLALYKASVYGET
jgi:GT2 family glycosyltransferase